MSRFFTFEWEGLDVRIRSMDLRRIGILSWLPYRTGDRFRVRVRIQGQSSQSAEYLTLSIGPKTFDPDKDVGSTLAAQKLGNGATQWLEFEFSRLILPGAFTMLVMLSRQEPGKGIVPVYVKEGASIQVAEDYKLIVNILNLVFGAMLGVAGTLLVQWLVSSSPD